MVEKFGMSLQDLAYDSIADLFTKDENGYFGQLTSYFNEFDFATSTEENIFPLIRRLVFSSTNRKIFKLYNSFSPELSKILRNIKLAINKNINIKYGDYFGETFLYPINYSPYNDKLPLIPSEFMYFELTARLRINSNTIHFINIVVDIIEKQSIYKKCYPLFELATIINEYYSSKRDYSVEVVPEPAFNQEEIENYLNIVLYKIEHLYLSKYLNKNKLSEFEKNCLLKTLRDILSSKFFCDDFDNLSYFELLKNYYQDLNEDHYKLNFRVILEYLAKISKSEMKELLLKEF